MLTRMCLHVILTFDNPDKSQACPDTLYWMLIGYDAMSNFQDCLSNNPIGCHDTWQFINHTLLIVISRNM